MALVCGPGCSRAGDSMLGVSGGLDASLASAFAEATADGCSLDCTRAIGLPSEASPRRTGAIGARGLRLVVALRASTLFGRP